MANADINQVVAAIRAASATGTAAEVLAAITAQTIPKIDDTRKVYSDVAVLLTSLGLPGNDIVDAIRDDLLANGPKWVCDQLGGSGVDFSHANLQSQIDVMLAANPPRLNPQIATILKGMGVWQESPLEVAAGQRGATTDEATVQAALDAIAAEQEHKLYDHRQTLISLVIQPNGKAIFSCRVVATTADGQQGETLETITTADADSFSLPNDLSAALAAVRQFVAGV